MWRDRVTIVAVETQQCILRVVVQLRATANYVKTLSAAQL
jgi:hypothetical protein